MVPNSERGSCTGPRALLKRFCGVTFHKAVFYNLQSDPIQNFGSGVVTDSLEDKPFPSLFPPHEELQTACISISVWQQKIIQIPSGLTDGALPTRPDYPNVWGYDISVSQIHTTIQGFP